MVLKTIIPEQAKNFVTQISNGLTCKRYISLYKIYPNNIIVTHHKSHAEYIDRMTGSKTCEACYRVFIYHEQSNKFKFNGTEYSSSYIYKIKGRMTKQKEIDLIKWIDKHIQDVI